MTMANWYPPTTQMDEADDTRSEAAIVGSATLAMAPSSTTSTITAMIANVA